MSRPIAGPAALLACLFAVPHGIAGSHPRLLIRPEDVPRLRCLAGLARPQADHDPGYVAARSADYQALRQHVQSLGSAEPLPGELAAQAFVCLLEGEAQRAALERVASELKWPGSPTIDPLERVLALDWAWHGLEPAVRREFIQTARPAARPLKLSDSPLEHAEFREKLAALALALVVDEEDEPGAAWAATRRRILEAAREYFDKTFPAFVQLRGLSPTSPAAAAGEESDSALAIELAGLLLGENQWERYRGSVGRWLEHYLLAALPHPALQHHFVRDDGSSAPLSPAPDWKALLPLTAHLIAARTKDPAAAVVADQVEIALRRAAGAPADAWRWVPIAMDTADAARVDTGQLPLARNLQGAIVLRQGNGPDAVAIWIEAGQPFLRRGQHFDAGHFLIHSGGHLVGSGGDDVRFEAVAAKGGSQHLGSEPGAWEFEQYAASTIAHNVIVFHDPARMLQWYGRPYAPVGGQRPIEGTCADFSAAMGADSRRTARLVAYGFTDSAAYAALDLAPAYEARTVRRYVREFLLLWGRVLIVVDRVEMARPRVVPTWVLNLPARPGVDGGQLRPDQRTAGSDDSAGVWRCDSTQWLRWEEQEGALWMRPLLPAPRRLSVVGGPARALRIPSGPHAGRTYRGGDADGFERLVIPSSRSRAQNAWYRLERPTLLGPDFGVVPHWGRIEIEPREAADPYLFVNVLIIGRAGSETLRSAEVESGDGGADVLRIALGEAEAEVHLAAENERGGFVQMLAPLRVRWELPTRVADDPPMALR